MSPSSLSTPLGLSSSQPSRPTRWTAADHALEILERLVVDGAFAPGDRVTEIALAERLNVSRTPLRQALGKLETKGWIHRSPNGAIHIADVSVQELEALYAVRGSLEDLVVASVAKRSTPSSLQELESLLQLQDHAVKAEDAKRVANLGEAFHRALWRQSENAVAIEFLEQVLVRTGRYRRLSFNSLPRFQEGNRQHWQLVRALQAADVDRARRVTHLHVAQSSKYALEAFNAWHQTSAARQK